MRALDFALDLLYPARCVACGGAEAWWCAACRSSVERVVRDPCPRCLSVDATHEVPLCGGTLPFASVRATGFYHSSPLRRLIAAVKYDGVTAAAADVEEYLRAVPLPDDFLIVPMPLADARERERGFNQAAWIAQRLKNVLRSPSPIVDDLLVRQASKYAQADLEHDPVLRCANVAGQFRAARGINRPVLLVDDVVTTGSTAGEAARALVAAGAPQVHLFALAVGQ